MLCRVHWAKKAEEDVIFYFTKDGIFFPLFKSNESDPEE
jgi:hypothetical protein